MSRGLGRLQVAILAHMQTRRGGDWLGDCFELQEGVHDMRAVAKEMARSGGRASDPSKRAAFSRAVRRLVECGHLHPQTTVPAPDFDPASPYARFIHHLSDGPYFVLPRRGDWQRRFVLLPSRPARAADGRCVRATVLPVPPPPALSRLSVVSTARDAPHVW